MMTAKLKSREIAIPGCVALAAVATLGLLAHAQQTPPSKQMQLPNPYRLVENWPTLPKNMNGGKWGELIRADIDSKGNIWVFHRCFNTEPAGSATCVGRSEPPILEFDSSGKLLASFGSGMFAFPMGSPLMRREIYGRAMPMHPKRYSVYPRRARMD
jgi:hypothetical protein